MRWALVTMCVLACTPEGRPDAPDAGCDEPDPRNPKGFGVGDPCSTSFECDDHSLVCAGEGTEETTCQTPPAIWDDGCYAAPLDSEHGHCVGADLNDTVEIEGDIGCAGEVRVYEILDPICEPCTDVLRQEVWRHCGCCWRLIRLIEMDPEACP